MAEREEEARSSGEPSLSLISISIRTTFMVPVNYLMSTFYYSQKFGLLKFSAVMIWGYFFPNSSIYIPKT